MADARRADRTEAEADDRLMVAVRGGDVARLGVLFERHHRALFNFFLRLTFDREASEDLVQDVFTRMLRYRATYQPGTQFRAWMYQMARNAHIDRFKARRHEVAMDDDTPEPVVDVPPVTADLEKAAEVALLREALARLPADKREVLVLSRFEGLKYEQVGRLLGCEEGAVKLRVFRAVRQLRSIYDQLVRERSGSRADVAVQPPGPRLARG